MKLKLEASPLNGLIVLILAVTIALASTWGYYLVLLYNGPEEIADAIGVSGWILTLAAGFLSMVTLMVSDLRDGWK